MKAAILSSPLPRSLELIFTPEKLSVLRQTYEIIETTDEALADLSQESFARVRYILGQPPISSDTLDQFSQLRAVFNVESNLIDNMPYQRIFERGIHVLTTGAVFATPVAELGLGLALDLARGITDADVDFRNSREKWGGDGNANARLLSGADVGIVGYGDLGRALKRLLAGFNCSIKVYDPWLPPSILLEDGVMPTNLDLVLSQSDYIFVVAAVTSDNLHFLNTKAFASMRQNTRFILLSRAEVVDFEAMMNAVQSGRILAASDVFPEEPLAKNHPVRTLPGFIRSAHRAGALDVAFKKMGDMVLEDMVLMDQSLPPMLCKRAERETVNRMRSKQVTHN